jgi:hypothetical protein
MPEHPRYWFPAKTYGWGWGLPSRWEGWLVLVGYLALLALCIKMFLPHQNLPGFIITVHVLSGLLIAICWWKGEPPKWRWGVRGRSVAGRHSHELDEDEREESRRR